MQIHSEIYNEVLLKVMEDMSKNETTQKSHEDKLCYTFHKLIKNKNMEKCNVLIEQNNIKLETLNKFNQRKQLGILLIQYYLTNNNFEKALEIYKYLKLIKAIRKRHINILLTWVLSNDTNF